MTLSKYRWILNQAGEASTLSLQLHSGSDVLNIGAKPIGYRAKKWNCRCENKLYAQPQENFPSGVTQCQACIKPLGILGCCENCWNVNFPDIINGEQVLFHAGGVSPYKTGFTLCSSAGSTVDTTIRLTEGFSLYPVLDVTVDETATDYNLIFVLHYGDNTYIAEYKITKQTSCSTKLLQLVLATVTTLSGTTVDSVTDWPNLLSITGSDCVGVKPDPDDVHCDCDEMQVIFPGMSNGLVGTSCYYSTDLIIESNSFFNWGTKGNQVVAGCKPQWNGGN